MLHIVRAGAHLRELKAKKTLGGRSADVESHSYCQQHIWDT